MKLLGAVLIFVSFGGLQCKKELCKAPSTPEKVPEDCTKYKCSGIDGEKNCKYQMFDTDECVDFSASEIECFNKVYKDRDGLFHKELTDRSEKYFYCNSLLSEKQCSVITCNKNSNKLQLECSCLSETYTEELFYAKGKKEQDVVRCEYTNGFLQARKDKSCNNGQTFSNKLRKCQPTCDGDKADPKSCKSYLKCDDNILNTEKPELCEDGKHFSAKDGKCKEIAEAKCNAPECKPKAYEYMSYECSSKKFMYCSVQDCPPTKNWDDKQKTCI